MSSEMQEDLDLSPIGDLVHAIVCAIVDDVDAVDVSEVIGKRSTVIEVEVADGDLGKVIGKQGALANSIRTILAAAGGRDSMVYVLEIVEEPRR